MKNHLAKIFVRDIGFVKEEIEAYDDESLIWKVEGEIANSAGNLCLHLAGNLNHFIGAKLGGSGYVRDRDAEFTDMDISKAELINRLDDASKIVEQTLTNLPDKKLEEDFTGVPFFEGKKVGYVLLHLLSHLNYHLGQINYHRRLVS